MHAVLISKEQETHCSIQHIEGYDLLCYKHNKQDLHYSIIDTHNNEYCPDTMNIYFIWDRQEQKRLSGMPWHGLVLHKMLNIDFLCSTYQVWKMTKKEGICNKYGLIIRKIAESDTQSLVHGLRGSGRSIYNKDTIQNILSACLLSQW
jgi:hypothetical protein